MSIFLYFTNFISLISFDKVTTVTLYFLFFANSFTNSDKKGAPNDPLGKLFSLRIKSFVQIGPAIQSFILVTMIALMVHLLLMKQMARSG